MVMDRVSRLTAAERRLHRAILRAFPHFGGPPPPHWLEEAARAEGASPAVLATEDVIQLDPATGAIVAAYPFSGVPTAHRVHLEGGATVNAMCAIDALGIPFMLGVDADVESRDPFTDEPLRITVREGAVAWDPPTIGVFAGCTEEAGPTSVKLCPTVNFFASPDSVEAYLATHPNLSGRVLDHASAIRSAIASFGSMLTEDGDASCDDPACCA